MTVLFCSHSRFSDLTNKEYKQMFHVFVIYVFVYHTRINHRIKLNSIQTDNYFI